MCAFALNLTVASKGGNENLSALAFANPKPTQVDLEGTEREADYLENNYSASKTYKNEKATLDRFKLINIPSFGHHLF